MNIDHYQKLAARTRKPRGIAEDLTHSSMGVVGEFGELINKIKKMVYHGHNNTPEIIEELGDCLWYIADIATTLEVDLHTVAAANIGKLVRRYPDGFSPERSINRDDGPASLNEPANEHFIYTDRMEKLMLPNPKDNPANYRADVAISGPTSISETTEIVERGLNHHIWQSEEPGQYSHNGAALGVDDGPASLNAIENEHVVYFAPTEELQLADWKGGNGL